MKKINVETLREMVGHLKEVGEELGKNKKTKNLSKTVGEIIGFLEETIKSKGVIDKALDFVKNIFKKR